MYPLTRSYRRLGKVIGAVAIAAFMAGCAADVEFDDRHLQPIPRATLSLMAKKDMSASDPIFVRLFKKESELEIWKRDQSGTFAHLKTFPMCRWSGQLGPKTQQGDRQAPEGIYHVSPELMNPRSSYHLSFNLGYPNRLEEALGYTGDYLMVHGACSSAGCYAMTDEGVSEIYAIAREAFAGGQSAFQVQALPFRMTAENLAKHRNNPNMAFWRNLKEGHDIFEATREVPEVSYCGRQYQFDASPVNDGDRLDPARACPALNKDRDPAVLAYQQNVDTQLAELIAEGMPTTAIAYSDGGMHPDFREMLQRIGPLAMSKRTSISEVPISRPDAALADPYTLLTGSTQ